MLIRVRFWGALLLAVLSVAVPAERVSAAVRCRTETLEGSVQAGAAYHAAIGGGPHTLQILLDPLPNGWRLRVVPGTGGVPSPDYAEIATPPYQSPSPLLLSTDFQFRAQDVIAWNLRHFQYLADAAAYRRLAKVYEAFEGAGKTGAGQLAEVVSHAPVGEFEILDARLVPGTANQSPSAAAVATHWFQTAHTTEQGTGGRGDPLGRVTWLKFRIRLDLPAGFVEAGSTGKLALAPCL